MRAISSENVPIPHAQLPAEALVQPEKSAVLERQAGDEVILTERRRSAALVFQIVFGGCLLFVWVGWTIVGASLLGRIVAERNLDDILFAVPFLADWFFALMLLCAIFFGRSCMRLGPDGLVQSWTILVFRGQRHVRLDEIKGFTEPGSRN